MKAAVIRFHGSNCDQDCVLALSELGVPTDYVWHKDTSLAGYDLVVLPGGFSYGDYLRCGAIARFSPIMKAVKEYAASGKLLMGICNGFQILCEAGLLPGALIRNRSLHFVCQHQNVRVEDIANPFLHLCRTGAALRIPIAHGEGSYTADAATIRDLERQGRILLRYVDGGGASVDSANPNGSIDGIAGIVNEGRNVFGLMPHPERACDPRLGSSDGRIIFESILASLGAISMDEGAAAPTTSRSLT
ncbi:MAG TPA: phosphoribosylformylglycinamidine synthase subunit PurQ [Chthoniobacter sp.]|nr:phosphoribosylformylglycinamidine synthase subunit PurQ [Chthoniobacter sp.]